MLYIENFVCYLFYHFKGNRETKFFTLDISQKLYRKSVNSFTVDSPLKT